MTFKKLLAIFSGLLIMAGAACAWHYWDVYWLVAFIFAISGCLLVWHGVE